MHDIIHFRSSSKIEKIGTWSSKMTHARSTDFDSLREYSEGDDARDIAWKQSAKWVGTFVRSTQSEQSISLMLIGDIDNGWTFQLEESSRNKHEFYKILKEQCQYTSHRNGNIYTENIYTSMGIGKISEYSIRNEKRKNLILLVTGCLKKESYKSLIPLARHNDMLIIHLLHPYERDPQNYEKLLMESRTPKISKYKIALDENLWTIQKELTRNNISYIEASTEDNPAELLNFFFKHRYDR